MMSRGTLADSGTAAGWCIHGVAYGPNWWCGGCTTGLRPAFFTTELPLYPTDAEGNSLIGYWRCRCGTVVPPAKEHRCPQ